MSLRAIDRAFQFAISPPDKLVLLTLANYTSATGLSFPSVTTICNKTRQDRKTVIRALDRLEHAGVIEDTGKRTGITKSVKIYRLNWAIEEAVPNPALLKQSQISAKQSQISHKQSQTTLENRNEPSITNCGSKRRPTLEEVTELAVEKGMTEHQAKEFWTYWESVGWKRNKQPITKWKAALANWKLNDERKTKHEKNRRPVAKVDRNIGTANEGKASQYAGIGKVKRVQNNR